MRKYMNLRLFDGEGGNGGVGAAGDNAGTGDGSHGGNAGGTFSFAQAEEIANARATRAERAALSSYFKQQGMSEDEVNNAIKAYKEQKAKNEPNIDAITSLRFFCTLILKRLMKYYEDDRNERCTQQLF